MSRNPKCDLCPLHRDARHVCLWGEANSRSVDILILGEAPGQSEDGVGRPFIGKSGDALRVILEDLGLLSRCYITNVVKCRPPANRTPKVKEVEACTRYWREELAAGKWKHIICLGLTALRAVTGDRKASLAQWRGRQAWMVDGIPALVTYHPAAALRAPDLWTKIVDDLQAVVKPDTMEVESIRWKVWDEKAPIPKLCALDLETTGLNPFDEGARILCVSWSSKDHSGVVSDNIEAVLKELHRIPNRTLIGHNLKFDLLWLRRFGYIHEGAVVDTQGMGRLVDENTPSTSLKWWATQVTGLGEWAKDIMQARSESAMDSLPRMKLLEYAAWDAGATWLLYKRLLPRINECKADRLMSYQGRVSKALVPIEAHGIHVNRTKLNALRRQLVNTVQHSSRMFPDDLNLGSPKQLGSYLYTDLRLPVLHKTPTGQASTDDETLERLLKSLDERNPNRGIVEALVTHRKANKILSTYINNLGELMDEDGYLHPSFNPFGTVTGRFSCSAPNLQNIPRNPDGPKSYLEAGNGQLLLECDYSQIELRVAASLSGDPAMKQAFIDGRDLHAETAKAMWGTKENDSDFKAKRTVAKIINFGIFYGMSPERLAKETGISHVEARKFIARWFDAYPGVREYLREIEEQVMTTGWVESMFGRRRRLPPFVGSKDQYHHAIRQACNHPVQSTASDLTVMAMTTLVERGIPVVGNIHDAILVAVDMDRVVDIAHEVLGVMEDTKTLCMGFGFRGDFGLPIRAEAKYGRTWGTMKPLERN